MRSARSAASTSSTLPVRCICNALHVSHGCPPQLSSSPLARGTHAPRSPVREAAGLIPACAGSTRGHQGYGDPSTAHPRSRGEHTIQSRAPSSRWGSSPLTRGTRALLRPRCTCQGLIPAHAGNTTQRPVMALCTWAHPRSREEHSSTARISKPPPGSSPLARGTRHSRTTARVSPGLIPARAGNTNPASARKGHGGAHPRSRGEHAADRRHRPANQGSSPLARGTRGAGTRRLR